MSRSRSYCKHCNPTPLFVQELVAEDSRAIRKKAEQIQALLDGPATPGRNASGFFPPPKAATGSSADEGSLLDLDEVRRRVALWKCDQPLFRPLVIPLVIPLFRPSSDLL